VAFRAHWAHKTLPANAFSVPESLASEYATAAHGFFSSEKTANPSEASIEATIPFHASVKKEKYLLTMKKLQEIQ
jgi:hypothetical protein